MTVITADRLNTVAVQTGAYGRSRHLPSLYSYAVHAARDRLKQTLSHLDEVHVTETTEPIHQVRIWSRRSLAALSLCTACFGSEGFAEVRREVKAAIDGLSDACDLDMIIEKLSQRAETLSPPQRVIAEAFLDNLRRQRLALDGQIFGAARRLERKDLLRRFDNAVIRQVRSCEGGTIIRGTVRHGRQQWFQGLEAPISLFGHASRILGMRLEAVLDFERTVYCPNKAAELHRMRLALKRLRYTMEIFEEIYTEHSSQGEEFHNALSRLEALQSQLGKIHDADVLVPRLSQFVSARLKADQSKGKHEAPVTGIQHIEIDGCLVLLTLCKEFSAGRDRDYGRFLDEWRQLRSDRFFDRLRGVLCAAEAETEEGDTRW